MKKSTAIVAFISFLVFAWLLLPMISSKPQSGAMNDRPAVAPKETDNTSPVATTNSVQAGAITLADAWIKPPLQGAKVTAAYLTIRNDGEESISLTEIVSPVGRIEIHTHSMDGDVMQMTKLDKLTVPSGETNVLTGGSDHLMVFDVKQTLEIGETIPLSLIFADGSVMKIQAAVAKDKP